MVLTELVTHSFQARFTISNRSIVRSGLTRLQYNMNRLTRDLVRRAAVRQPAQGLVEYAFILAGVALAVVVALFALGPRISAFYTSIGTSIPVS